jgi:hypothetical protein
MASTLEIFMSIRTSIRAALACVAVVVCSMQLAAQSTVPQAAPPGAPPGVALSGKLLNSLTNEAVADAAVMLDELRRETKTAADGTFTFDNVPPGTYHISVRGSGLSSRRTEVTAGTGATPVTVTVDPELHFEEVVSVSGEARSQFWPARN